MDYQTPSEQISQLAEAPARPYAMISPDKRWIAFAQYNRLVPLQDLTREELKLAGLKIDPKRFSRKIPIAFHQLSLKDLKTNQDIEVQGLPEGKILHVSWSADSQFLAFVFYEDSKSTLWIYDVLSKQVRQLSKQPLNGILMRKPYVWLPNAKGLVVNIAASKPKNYPIKKAAAIQPIIQVTTGEKAPNRTYQNLLSSPYEEAVFEYLTTSRLAKLSLAGNLTYLTQPGLFSAVEVSPDGKYVLTSSIKKPFSYLVPYHRFPKETRVIDFNGKQITEVADLALAENIPQGFDSVRLGRRSVEWRHDLPATLVWVEAQDGGDMSKDVPFHDIAYQWHAPFQTKPTLLRQFEWRFAGFTWGNSQVALADEWRFSDRQTRSWKINFSQTAKSDVLFQSRSINDAYKDPGHVQMTRNEFGKPVMMLDEEQNVLFAGEGASPKGNIPFLNRYNFDQQKKTTLWQSEAPYYERVVAVLDKQANRVVTLRESKQEQPNFFIRDLKKNSLSQVSHFAHPSPAFKGVSKELISYKRDDGVDLTGTLYLPAGYKKGDRIPVLMWAYPLEFKDKSVAGQVRESKYAFNYVSYWGPLPYLAKGYAVFDDPQMPIVGAGEQLPNDTFREQLISSAKAAVDVLVKKGVADPKRIAIAGHSYGAFMVANLLAHTDLFIAGIARSGAYNRTLTPFGFQGEERSFWEGQAIYAAMSPFFHAEKINEPMLIIHGKEDSNSGTYPMQSERMFAAMKGLGGDARLVMLPYEAHGYYAKESMLHVLWEQEEFLERNFKNQEK
nr:prolyl oligopeptidase family serine peptidase [Algicola sagamiensis]